MALRAASGGQTVGGKFFKGGQFIGADYIAKQNLLDTGKIIRKEKQATFDNLRHAAFSISKDAKASIKKSSEPSAVGEPPSTRGIPKQNIRGAIFVDVGPTSAVIGPRESFVGESAAAHEFGKQYKGDKFEKRPTMGPALERSTSRFANRYEGSIGE